MDVFFLNINWPAAEIGSCSHPEVRMVAFLISAIWFVRIYVIRNARWKNGYYEKCHFLFCGCLRSRCPSLPIAHPWSCNRGYLTASPLWNFKNKKKKSEEANTAVTIICNVIQIYVFNYCSKTWRRKMDFQSKQPMQKWENFDVEDLHIFGYLYIDMFYKRHWWRNHRFRNINVGISNDMILKLFYTHIFTIVIYIVSSTP